MGRIEHITTQQIIGEWASIENFASSHGVSPASTKMVIYVDGANRRGRAQEVRVSEPAPFREGAEEKGADVLGVSGGGRAQPGGAYRNAQDEGDAPGGRVRAQAEGVLEGAGEGFMMQDTRYKMGRIDRGVGKKSKEHTLCV